MRVLCWFSCGAASAVAAKLAIEKYGNKCEVIYCDTSEDEHPDNMRFLKDVEKWLGVTIKFLKSEKYKNVDDVIERTGFLVGPRFAPCTNFLKTDLRKSYQREDDIHVFGYTVEEKNRIMVFDANNSHLEIDWILEENNITKANCYAHINKAGIRQNQMYLDGFHNANCLGCVKAANFAYWGRVKRLYPEIYAKRAKQERMVNATINKDQRGGKRKRIFLDEMTQKHFDRGRNQPEPDIECGVLCTIPEDQQEFDFMKGAI